MHEMNVATPAELPTPSTTPDVLCLFTVVDLLIHITIFLVLVHGSREALNQNCSDMLFWSAVMLISHYGLSSCFKIGNLIWGGCVCDRA